MPPLVDCNCPRLIMRSTNYCLLSCLITARCLTLSSLPLLSPPLPPPAPTPPPTMNRMKRELDVLEIKPIHPPLLESNDEQCLQSGTVVLRALDVVVQTAGFISHPGNLMMNNLILESIKEHSSLHHRIGKAEWLEDFISG